MSLSYSCWTAVKLWRIFILKWTELTRLLPLKCVSTAFHSVCLFQLPYCYAEKCPLRIIMPRKRSDINYDDKFIDEGSHLWKHKTNDPACLHPCAVFSGVLKKFRWGFRWVCQDEKEQESDLTLWRHFKTTPYAPEKDGIFNHNSIAVHLKHHCLLSAVLHGKLDNAQDNRALYLVSGPTKVTQEATQQNAVSLQDVLIK